MNLELFELFENLLRADVELWWRLVVENNTAWIRSIRQSLVVRQVSWIKNWFFNEERGIPLILHHLHLVLGYCWWSFLLWGEHFVDEMVDRVALVIKQLHYVVLLISYPHDQLRAENMIMLHQPGQSLVPGQSWNTCRQSKWDDVTKIWSQPCNVTLKQRGGMLTTSAGGWKMSSNEATIVSG